MKKKTLSRGILFIIFLLTTIPFFASDGTLTDEQSEQTYVSNEIIVKLKGGAAHNLQSHLLSRSSTINMAATTAGAPVMSSELDTMLRENGVVSIKPLSSGFYQRMRTTGKTGDQLRQSMVAANDTRVERGADIHAFAIEDIFVLTTDGKCNLRDIINKLNSMAEVAYAEPNIIMTLNVIPNDPFYSSTGSWGQSYDDLWGLKTIDTDKAWDTAHGAGVVVAVIDTGIDYTHEDLKSSMWINPGEIAGNNIDDDNNGYVDDIYGYDFASKDNDPMDNMGHGTHCAGTIAAAGHNRLGVVGVAPAAKLMAVRGFQGGDGQMADLVNCLYYAIENGADVLSNSWVGRGTVRVLEEVFDYAQSLGVIAVAAAGNYSTLAAGFTPANIDSVITVAALDPSGSLADFSNYGAKVDVTAPGVEILSTMSDTCSIATSSPQKKVAPGYYRLNGTSMACPHVAGLAALVKSNYKEEDFDNYREAIISMITGSTAPFINKPSRQAGTGVINAHNAVTMDIAPDIICNDYQFVEMEGNGDGHVDSSEKVALIITLENKGFQTVTGLQATLSTNSPYIKNIVGDQAVLGSIKQGEIKKYASVPFILDMAAIPDHLRRQNIHADLTLQIIGDAGYQTEIGIKALLKLECLTKRAFGDIYSVEASDTYVVWTELRDMMAGHGLMVYERQTGNTRLLPMGADRFIDLQGDMIVFCHKPEGSSSNQLFIYNLATNTYEQLTDVMTTQREPKIDGDHIIWVEYNSGYNIWLYTISTGIKKQIAASTGSYDMFHHIKGNTILWKGKNRLYTYDIPTGTTRELPLDYSSTAFYYEPEALSANLVAYAFVDNNDPASYTGSYIYNRTTGENIKFADLVDLPGTAPVEIVDIVDNTIVFSYLTKGKMKDNHYQTYNMDTGQVAQITGLLSNYNMTVNGNELIWQNQSEGALYVSTVNTASNVKEVNLSLLPDTKIYASSQFGADFTKENAVDGNDNTAWGSAPASVDKRPIMYLDLTKQHELTKIIIKFYPGFHASSLILGVSNDMKKWTTAKIAGKETVELDIAALRLKARYVGFQCLEGSAGVYGIKEFEVWGNQVTVLPTPTPPGVPVTIADAGLERVIRYNLDKPAGIIYSSELAGMETLYGPYSGITDLSPLSHCTDIKYVDISGNAVGDIGALAGNTGVYDLTMANCGITDISVLAGMTQLEYVFIQHNAIKDLSAFEKGHERLRDMDVSYNTMVIKDDGGQGTINLNVIKRLLELRVDLEYAPGNITQ